MGRTGHAGFQHVLDRTQQTRRFRRNLPRLPRRMRKPGLRNPQMRGGAERSTCAPSAKHIPASTSPPWRGAIRPSLPTVNASWKSEWNRGSRNRRSGGRPGFAIVISGFRKHRTRTRMRLEARRPGRGSFLGRPCRLTSPRRQSILEFWGSRINNCRRTECHSVLRSGGTEWHSVLQTVLSTPTPISINRLAPPEVPDADGDNTRG